MTIVGNMNGKRLVIFDLDGTLAVSKSPMDTEMAQLVIELLKQKEVAVISGGSFKQFQYQFLTSLNSPEDLLPRLYLFPTCSTSFYTYTNGLWNNVYQEDLTFEEKGKIMEAFVKTLDETKFEQPKELYGELVEDRGTQITFSALGQQAPIELKEKWDPDHKKRLIIIEALKKYIPEFEIKSGGTTSIDVTRKGIDKAYGIRQIQKHLGVQIPEMLFIGDAIFPGGNDYPVKETGVESIQVKDHEECKKVIRSIVTQTTVKVPS